MHHPTTPPSASYGMPPFPAGLAPAEGIPMVAQAVLHRELLHIHSSLALVQKILRQPVAILSPPFIDRVTCPQLQAHLRGLEAALLHALRVSHTALHYTHELLTVHIVHHSPEQLEDELCGRTSFGDRPPFSSTSTTTSIGGCIVLEGQTYRLDSHPNPPSRTSGGTTVGDMHSGPTPRDNSDRSRSRSRLNPR